MQWSREILRTHMSHEAVLRVAHVRDLWEEARELLIISQQ